MSDLCGFLDWFPLSEAVGIYMNAGGLAGCCIWTYLHGHGASTANIASYYPSTELLQDYQHHHHQCSAGQLRVP